MEISTFESLLNRMESDTLDFKASQYDFSGIDKEEQKIKRAKFVKDILSMVNTPREQTSYIVLGVKCYSDGNKDIKGVELDVDDADLQGLILGWVHPHPRFTYIPVFYKGEKFGVIEIPPDRSIGPCLSTIDVGEQLLRRNQVYYRAGSRNTEANQTEQKRIFKWFEESADMPLIKKSGYSVWDEFVDAVDGFRPDRHYVLAISPINIDSSLPMANLGTMGWTFVVDFDPSSEVTGILSVCQRNVEKLRTLHRVTKGDYPTLNPVNATYWYFARGINGRDSTLSTGKWLTWQRDYDRDMRNQLENLARNSVSKPTTVIAIWNDDVLFKHLESFLSAVSSAFGTGASLVVVTSDPDTYGPLSQEFEAKLFNIPLYQFLSGLTTFRSEALTKQSLPSTFPSTSGASVEIGESDLLWLQGEMEVVHQNVGMRLPEDVTPGIDFLRGREVTWYDLGLHYDVDREITDKLRVALRTNLDQRGVGRVNLYHAPGAGGTTIARRLLWDLRNEFPCLILHQTVRPSETAERIAQVAAMTSLPVLLGMDGNEISERQSDDLYEVLAARQIPVTMFQILRRFKSQAESSKLYLRSWLTDGEAEKFTHSLARVVPEKRSALEKAVKSGRSIERSPFYLGLIAFEHDFRGLPNYVSSRITDLTDTQLKILAYIALAHYYGQQVVTAQAFATILGIPASRLIDLRNALPEFTTELLVEVEKGQWRTAHQLIAWEILQQLLTPSSGDRRLWNQQLSNWGIDFIDFCRGDLPEPSYDGLELVRRVFIYRDNSELLGTERSAGNLFAQFIDDVPSGEGKLRVLQHLVTIFPNESHFWAHLGRFYSSALEDFDKSVDAINHAIQLSPDDNLLYHMKGMALRSKVYSMIRESVSASEVILNAKLASEAFAEARTLNPEDDYGYISDTQMIARVLDYCARSQNVEPILVAANASDPWLRESVQQAEDLLMQVRRSHQGETPSEYEEKCRADLDALYGNHSSALQIWDNLLSRRDPQGRPTVYAPPVRRQIVWAYLARKKRRWDSLQGREVSRIVELLEENLRDEPNDERNLRLWMQAIRRTPQPPTLEEVIEKVAYWKSNSGSLDAVYYLYVLYAIQAIDGSRLARDNAARTLEESRNRARYRRDRTKSYEWLGKESGLRQLVHQERLGDWDEHLNFWRYTAPLKRVSGVIASIQGPQAGIIEVPGGLNAFFVPVPRHGSGTRYSEGRSENQRVSFFLGFSYEGLRAWSVEDVL